MNASTFAERVNQFNRQLSFTGKLPKGIRIMNPFQENQEVIGIAEQFYNLFYNDFDKRRLILGINPGRLGAGVTGIPFTDTKRLAQYCDIRIGSVATHEPSSVFVYDLIDRYGGAEKFYRNFYINSICPLGFIELNDKQNWVNRNYYDYPELFASMQAFIAKSLKEQLGFGIDTEVCFVLGKRNAMFLKKINDKEGFFRSIVVFDHPRYIEQYKSKERDTYIAEFLRALQA